MLTFGELWLIHELKESALFLGYVGAGHRGPRHCAQSYLAASCDRLDKRRLIIVTQAMSALLIFLLATLTLLDLVTWQHVLAIAFVTGAVNAFDQPARQALYPHLIDRKVMMSAVAMNSSIWQGTRIAAPAAAGIIIAATGTAVTFFLAGLGFVIMAAVISGLRVPHRAWRHGQRGPRHAGGSEVIKRNSIFSFLIGMTFFNSFFGMAYIMMMPVFAVDILKVGADGQGILLSVGGVGALMTTLLLGSIGNFRRRDCC